MVVKLRFFIIVSIVLLSAAPAAGQKYSVLTDPLCWYVNGQDSSITRLTYISSREGVFQVAYINAAGETVNVSAGIGLLYNEYCDCCPGGHPENTTTPGADSISIQIVRLDDPITNLTPGVDSCEAVMTFRVIDTSPPTIVTITIDAVAQNYTYNPSTGFGDVNIVLPNDSNPHIIGLSAVSSAGTDYVQTTRICTDP